MQVWPKDESIRKLLRHEPDGPAFYETGPAEWPDDTFTYRRIMDGDVTTEDPGVKAETASETKKARAPKTE